MEQNPETTSAWNLTGKLGEGAPISRIAINKSPFQVGRSHGLSLVIPSATVSGVHAELVLNGDQLIVRDLGSTNGTFVNGSRIEGDRVIREGDLVQFSDIVFRAGTAISEMSHGTVRNDTKDRALALIQLDQLLAERAVVPFFQPLIDIHSLDVIGFEVLGRSRLFGLGDAKTMFTAAAAMNAEDELSRMIRSEGIRIGRDIPGTPNVFLNTFPGELKDTELLLLSLNELRELDPNLPMTLEIHEASIANPQDMRALRKQIAALNIGMAYDDFGAGQARLLELAEEPPDYLKFDLRLIHGIKESSELRCKLLENLVRMAKEMGIVPLAEGIETTQEHEICTELGFEMGQGFLYGRPAAATTWTNSNGLSPRQLVVQSISDSASISFTARSSAQS